ncbi:MAG: DUF1292 domain-containing protein [Lachnospiraceae bacterium]|jgi:hypothetical protein|nr:DUF1292 domain-containing protein [Lachnospiraceae bacterium]MBQ6089768.1 DUF1292 domain-containing protein [Lachnospiraceae bacterium]MBR5369185.1 DUF1292 domain-containing protein [Lachnospiraceae bacterium]MBR6293358.1 DUF1292 domain-containing protein [Lachnospiraceae bacterium]
MDNTIMFTTDDGENVEFTVIEEARLSGETYLLVTADEKDEDEVAYVLREVKSEDKTEASYEMVEDDDELAAVTGLFNEVLDGEMDIVVDKLEE